MWEVLRLAVVSGGRRDYAARAPLEARDAPLEAQDAPLEAQDEG
jgi:hypothetical protein